MSKPQVPQFARALLPSESLEDDKLIQFLQSVEGLFCEDGVSRKAREQFALADSEVRESKSKAIQAHLLTEEAKNIISEQYPDDDKENASPGGITADDIKAAFGSDEATMSDRIHEMRSAVVPLLEQRLRVRCEALAGFCEPRAGLSFGKTFFLPDLLQKRQTELQQKETEVWNKNADHLSMLCELLQMQAASIDIISRLIDDFKLKWQAEDDEGKKAELIAYTQAQVIKVAKIRDEVRVETYTEQTTPALQRIREMLQEERQKLEREKAETEARLRAYEHAGPLLEELVAEQQKVLHEIQEKQWALQQVKEG